MPSEIPRLFTLKESVESDHVKEIEFSHMNNYDLATKVNSFVEFRAFVISW
jgi:hypothetical protein